MQERIDAFVKLGSFLGQFSKTGFQQHDHVELNDLFFDGFAHQIKIAEESNSWFTKENILFAIHNWATALTQENIEKWLLNTAVNVTSKKVAIIMAGNIPLVGFHDFLSVLISGHSVVVKQSSNDKHLLPFLAKYLEYVEPSFKGTIEFTEEKLTNYDAVIATGSNNTARYFEHYFGAKPHIIRKNRNSVAILTGNETSEELEKLSDDIFQYFGLGCRNVSKIYVPKGYNFDPFFKGVFHKKDIIHNAKYANNYDYNKAVYLMSEFDLLENGFLMIKEDTHFASPIATLFYEYYSDIEEVTNTLEHHKDNIQCVVSRGVTKHEIAFGQTQNPQLWDYADGVNTLDFLASI